jgi:hypothetical protein
MLKKKKKRIETEIPELKEVVFGCRARADPSGTIIQSGFLD